MEPSNPADSAATASMFVPDDRLAAAAGVGSYLYDPSTQTLTASGVAPASVALQFYRVSEINGEGSWWVPTVAQSRVPPNWPNPVNLEATGPGIWTEIGGEPVQIATGVVWWLPLAAQDDVGLVPGIAKGELSGDYPQVSPAGT